MSDIGPVEPKIRAYLDFERPIAELEAKIAELRKLNGAGPHPADGTDAQAAGEAPGDGANSGIDIEEEIGRLQGKADDLLRETYSNLAPWQKTQVARHPNRPHASAYVEALIEGFLPLAGDRYFGEDTAVLGGIGRFNGRSVVVIGHEKGSDTKSRMRHNFGMARPEGYRKAVRLMRLAERFKLPVITIVDTPGAYPGIGAEERGQAEAIARSTETCLDLGVPIITCVVGEGGSGGAVALATANTVLMLEHAIYAVISPEGCASILWRSAEKAREAAEAMKLTAQDLKSLGIIDRIVPEPMGGAHRAPQVAIAAVGKAIEAALGELIGREPGHLRQHRREKFLNIGSPGLA